MNVYLVKSLLKIRRTLRSLAIAVVTINNVCCSFLALSSAQKSSNSARLLILAAD